jgi:hypothetical protein
MMQYKKSINFAIGNSGKWQGKFLKVHSKRWPKFEQVLNLVSKKVPTPRELPIGRWNLYALAFDE